MQIRLPILFLLLCILSLVVLQPSLQGEFLWDDDLYLTGNSLIRSSEGLRDFWFSMKAADYYPLSSSTLWLEWRLWGDNPAGYRLTNALLHALNSLLLIVFLRRLGLRGALWAGLFFLVHPVNIETAAWIAQRKTLLATTFALLSSMAYLRAREGSIRFHVLSFVAFGLSLLSKTTAVALPAVFVLFDLLRDKRLTAATIRRVTPHFVLAFVLGLVTVVFQAGNSIADVVVRPEGFTSRLAAAGWVVWLHLSKALVPLALSPLYPRWVVDPANPAAYVPLVMLGLVVLLLWLMRKRVTAWPLVGLLAYIALLFPTLGFLDIGFFIYALVADHWQYVAIPVIAAGFGWCAGRLTTPPAVRSVGIVLCAAWLVALSILARDYARAFASPKAFWSRAVELDPTVWKAHIGLGSALVAEGETAAGRKYLKEAIKLRPDNSEAHANLGVAYAMDEQLGDAYTHLRRAIELDPKRREARISLAAVCAGSGREAEAIEHYEVALSNNPETVSVMLRLSSLLAESTNTAARNPARAVELSQRVVQIAPDAWVARESLARALRSSGDSTNAVAEASRAASIADELGLPNEGARIRAEFGL